MMSYKPFFKTLVDLGIKKGQLTKDNILSRTTMAKTNTLHFYGILNLGVNKNG